MKQNVGQFRLTFGAPMYYREGWRASYCFGNLYRDGQDTSGAHADRFTLLGTRSIIASLSLGASRLFRVLIPLS